MSATWRLRAGALTLIGSLAVHQGRYLAVPRHDDHHSHAYFEWFVPALAALAFVLVAEFARRLVHARRERPAALPSAWRLWVAAAAALIAIFCAQEAAETYYTHGVWLHPVGLLAEGGWVALALAVPVGAAIALLLRGAERAVEWARRRLRAAPLRAAALHVPDLPFVTPRGAQLARRLAGRAPPLAR